MFNIIKNKINNLEKDITKIMKNGLNFSFGICLFSILILVTYQSFFAIPDLYYIGLILFKTSLTFIIQFIICGFAFDTIKKQMV